MAEVNRKIGTSDRVAAIRHFACIVRTWYYFHIKWPFVKYNGFVRVMKGTWFSEFDIQIGNNVQFGNYCDVSYPLYVGNNVLFAARVCFVGKQDHQFDTVGETIWNGKREMGEPIVIGNDVWLGHRVTVVGPVKIGSGSIVATGSVVTQDIPPCEIWGGVPARKIRDRFPTEEDKITHLNKVL